jgi:hypothetical protein
VGNQRRSWSCTSRARTQGSTCLPHWC